jgi:hypothetical protein
MVIHHDLGNIELDDEDVGILESWQFLTVQNQGRWQYAILYSERVCGSRTSKYLSRAVMEVTDPEMEIQYKDKNGLNCKKSNLVVVRKTWLTRKKRKNAKCSISKA